MAVVDRPDDVWRLPRSVGGGDVRLASNPAARPLSASSKARLRRIVTKTPEAMVKVTGRARGIAGHLKAHLDYITRNGRIAAETQDGERIVGREHLRELHDEWLLANALSARGRPSDTSAQSVGIILSMRAGTPPDRVEATARTWARETFAGTHDWLMARHDDTGHAHVHITVRAVGYDGRRLAPGPEDLQSWRERFARELRRLGVDAEATPRQARGIVRKSAPSTIHHSLERGSEPRVRRVERDEATRDAHAPRVRRVERDEATRDAHAPRTEPRAWSRALQARQSAIRRTYLAHAAELGSGDPADRQLARDIVRFVADMPVQLTRRRTIALELRRVLEQRPMPAPPSTTATPPNVQRSVPTLTREPRIEDTPTRKR